MTCRAGRVRHAAAATVLVGTLALAACGGAGGPKIRQSGPTATTESGIARPYGHGSSRVWVLTPKEGEPRSVVVFIHGWTATSPFVWHQVWLDHLLARGSAIVFPAYQSTGGENEFATAPYSLRDGLQRGFRALGQPDLPVVAAGFSVGGALAFYYAADATGWGVPRPAAVYSIFPSDPLAMDPGLIHLGPPPRVRIVMLIGDRDEVVGRVGADTFWSWLAPVPRALRSYRLLRSDPDGLFFFHDAPTDIWNPGTRAVFWRPLDRLVEQVRGRAGS